MKPVFFLLQNIIIIFFSKYLNRFSAIPLKPSNPVESLNHKNVVVDHLLVSDGRLNKDDAAGPLLK